MSSYNLKAKRRDTGEIVEVTIMDNYQATTTGYDIVGDGFYLEKEFNTIFEVITDTQEDKVCSKCGFSTELDTNTGVCWSSECKGEVAQEDRDKLVSDILSILTFQAGITAQGWNYTGEKDWALNKILKLVDEAYKQGQADAYGESASVARDTKKQYKENKFGDNFLYDGGFIGACEEITQELARQREGIINLIKEK